MAESLPQLTIDALLSALHQYRAFLPGDTPVVLALDAKGDVGTPMVLATLGFMRSVDPDLPDGLRYLDGLGEASPAYAETALIMRGLDRVSRSLADAIPGADEDPEGLSTAWPDALEEVQP